MRLLVAVGAMLVLVACGSSEPVDPPSTPSSTSPDALSPAEAAVDGLMRALEAGDCTKAQDLVLTPSELGCDAVEQSAGMFADEGIDLDAATYRAGEVHDASATVSITWGPGIPSESYDVQKVGDAWKVVFDSAA